jgi:DNA-binding MarR family transcriptional regulator
MILPTLIIHFMRTIEPVPAGDRERIEGIIADFRRALLELRCIGSERLIRHGVSMSHLYVMSMLERHGEMPMSRVAELIDVSLSNATGLIDRMEERGLVERFRVPDDRRVVLVRVTDHGRSVLAELEVLREDLLGRVLARLDATQLERVARAMEDLKVASLDAMATDPDVAALAIHAHAHGTPRRPRD